MKTRTNTADQFKAADIMAESHPLHRSFKAWCERRNAQHGGGAELTKRKARKYLAQFPQYRRSLATAA